MRTFEHFPEEVTCPICKTNDDRECTLIPIAGTEDGGNCEAQPVHVDCVQGLDLTFMKEEGVFFARI